MEQQTQLLEQLKETSFSELSCRLWVIKKSSRNGVASYRALSAAVDGLESDFRSTLSEFFCGRASAREPIRSLHPYSALTVDVDEDRALFHSVNSTDLECIIEQVQEGGDNQPVTDIQQFHNAWALVIEFGGADEKFYAFSKVKGGWNIKRSITGKNWTFTEGQFKRVDAEKIFTFRSVMDFVAYGESVFIRDKANYELGLNIREGLEARRDVLVAALAENGIIACVDQLKIAIGTNKTLLRRLVAAEETRYFEDEQFIEDMKGIIDSYGWELPADDEGKFIIDENNIDLFLKLINDKRFLSLIKRQMVDADAVELVE